MTRTPGRPAANPAPLVAGVLARPEFAMQPNAERDLERIILTLLKGLVAA